MDQQAPWLKNLIRYSWLIVILAVLAGAVTYVVSNSLPKQYESRARVLLGSLSDPDLQQQLGYQQLARVYASLADTPLVLNEVKTELGLQAPVAELAKTISALALVDTSIVNVSATADTPADAVALAEAVVNKIVEFGRAAPGQPSLAQIIQPAVTPQSASSPLVLVNTAVAAFLGLSVGLLLALLLGSLQGARDNRKVSNEAPAPLSFPTGPYSR